LFPKPILMVEHGS